MSRPVRTRSLIAACLLVLFALAVGLYLITQGREDQDEFAMCGEMISPQSGVISLDFGDRYGESVANSRSLLPADGMSPPATIGDVVVVPDRWSVDDMTNSIGPGLVELGYLNAEDGSCRVWLLLSTGEAMPPGRSEEWMVTAGESD